MDEHKGVFANQAFQFKEFKLSGNFRSNTHVCPDVVAGDAVPFGTDFYGVQFPAAYDGQTSVRCILDGLIVNDRQGNRGAFRDVLEFYAIVEVVPHQNGVTPLEGLQERRTCLDAAALLLFLCEEGGANQKRCQYESQFHRPWNNVMRGRT